MPLYWSLWMQIGCCLSVLLVAVGTMECTEQESRVQEIPRSVVHTQCLMDCTVLTFSKAVELDDKPNIRITDSTEEEHRNLTEYCWPLSLKCTVGERLQRAFVVVPVDQSVVAHQDLTVNATGPNTGALSVHSAPSALADDCGIRYEVTSIYQSTLGGAQGAGAFFCVQVVARKPLSGVGVLKCPPFLGTVWKMGADQSERDGGG